MLSLIWAWTQSLAADIIALGEGSRPFITCDDSMLVSRGEQKKRFPTDRSCFCKGSSGSCEDCNRPCEREPP